MDSGNESYGARPSGTPSTPKAPVSASLLDQIEMLERAGAQLVEVSQELFQKLAPIASEGLLSGAGQAPAAERNTPPALSPTSARVAAVTERLVGIRRALTLLTRAVDL